MYNNQSRAENKKFIVLSLVFASVFIGMFALYGCQLFQAKQDQNVTDEQPQERRIGVIKSLGGIHTTNQGTHLLQLDSGETILLRSLQVNLDDSKYIGKTVEVFGPITYTTDQKQIMMVNSVDVISNDSTEQTTVITMKDYTNEKLGLTMKYRDDFKLLNNTEDGVTISKDVSSSTQGSTQTQTNSGSNSQAVTTVKHTFTITSASKKGQTILDYLKSSYPTIKSLSSVDLSTVGLSNSKVGSKSYDSIKKVDPTTKATSYIVDSGDYFITFTLDSGNDEKSLDDQNLFYEMLSSLTLNAVSPIDQPNTPTQQASQQVSNKDSSKPDLPGTKDRTLNFDSSTSLKEKSQADSGKKKDEVSNSTDSGSTQVKDSKTTSTTSTTNTNTTKKEESSNTDSLVGTDAEPSVEGLADAIHFTGETQAVAPGYEKLDSSSFKFSLLYPKKWYYSGSASTETNVIRKYEFGNKPIEETPGSVTLDVMSGKMPAGENISSNGKEIVKVTNGDTVQIYVKGKGSRIYRFYAPGNLESVILNMAGTVTD